MPVECSFMHDSIILVVTQCWCLKMCNCGFSDYVQSISVRVIRTVNWVLIIFQPLYNEGVASRNYVMIDDVTSESDC